MAGLLTNVIFQVLLEELEIKKFRGRLPPEGPYYHGTTTAFGITDTLLPPSETGKQTEKRVQRKGKVFITTDLEYAHSYARRAVKQWGGNPVVFEVQPLEILKQISGRPGQSAFYTNRAKILKVVSE